MKERIKELALRAGGFVDLNQHVGGEKGCMVYTYDGLEKIAELIIQECISICKDKERPNLYGVREVEVAIKKHFGVKE